MHLVDKAPVQGQKLLRDSWNSRQSYSKGKEEVEANEEAENEENRRIMEEIQSQKVKDEQDLFRSFRRVDFDRKEMDEYVSSDEED